MSRRLTERSIDHVVLERGEVANSWRTERWDSLRLLTPNWQTRLPGHAYGGDDPDGFMTMPEVVAAHRRLRRRRWPRRSADRHDGHARRATDTGYVIGPTDGVVRAAWPWSLASGACEPANDPGRRRGADVRRS